MNPNHIPPRVAASTAKRNRAPELRSIARAIDAAFPTASDTLRMIAAEMDEETP